MNSIDEGTTLRLRSEFEVIPLEDERVLLRSPSQGVRVGIDGVAADELATLFADLDGTRPLGSLLRNRWDLQKIAPLLDGLMSREIVELGGARDVIPAGARFFSYFHDDAIACWQRLTASKVLVKGSGPVAEAVGHALTAAGICDVRTITDGGHSHANGACSEHQTLARSVRNADLVIVCPGDASLESETTINELALKIGFAWLPVRIFGAEGFVGPLFVPGDGPCHTCVRAREEANWADPDLTRKYMARLTQRPASSLAYGALPGFASLVGQWAVLEATKYLSRFTVPVLIGNVLRIDFVGCQTQVHRVLRLPRCSSCSPLARRPVVSGLCYAEAL